jgi:hypothetical protein
VIILGIILVVLGYALGISDLGIIGVIFLIIGAIFWSLRAISRVLVSQLGTERHKDQMPAARWTNIGEPLFRTNSPYSMHHHSTRALKETTSLGRSECIRSPSDPCVRLRFRRAQ